MMGRLPRRHKACNFLTSALNHAGFSVRFSLSSITTRVRPRLRRIRSGNTEVSRTYALLRTVHWGSLARDCRRWKYAQDWRSASLAMRLCLKSLSNLRRSLFRMMFLISIRPILIPSWILSGDSCLTIELMVSYLVPTDSQQPRRFSAVARDLSMSTGVLPCARALGQYGLFCFCGKAVVHWTVQ